MSGLGRGFTQYHCPRCNGNVMSDGVSEGKLTLYCIMCDREVGMANYEYICRNKNCSLKKFEKLAVVDKRHETKCPDCGRKAELQISVSTFVMVGGMGV